MFMYSAGLTQNALTSASSIQKPVPNPSHIIPTPALPSDYKDIPMLPKYNRSDFSIVFPWSEEELSDIRKARDEKGEKIKRSKYFFLVKKDGLTASGKEVEAVCKTMRKCWKEM